MFVHGDSRSPYRCLACGERFDEPHVFEEEEVLLFGDYDHPEDLAEALDLAGKDVCPDCGSTAITGPDDD